jgi:hypothetical protein
LDGKPKKISFVKFEYGRSKKNLNFKQFFEDIKQEKQKQEFTMKNLMKKTILCDILMNYYFLMYK